jgi:hypothetical protein
MFLDNPAVWLFAAIAGPCAFLAIKYWQGSLLGVFVLVVFEGALRKWAFPWAQAYLYFVKDAIILAAYLGFILDSRRNLFAPEGTGLIKLVLVVCVVWGCLEVLNPYSPSILVGLIGLKAYFLYAPIAFILPYAIRSREYLFVLIRRYLIIAIPVAVLGFIQIIAGPASSLNTYVQQSEDAPDMLAYFGHENLVRTSGTFSYISGYTAFLTFVAFLAVGYNMAHGWRIKNNVIPILTLALLIGAMFTTGSRAPVFYLLAASPVILWLSATSGILSRQAFMRLCMVLPIVAILALNASPQALQAFMERTEEANTRGETLERFFIPLSQTIGVLSDVPALGTGIGTAHPAALSLMGAQFPWWLPYGTVTEDEISRVMVEQGPIGFLLNYFLRFLIAAFGLRCARSFKDPAYRALGIVLAVWLVIGIPMGIVINFIHSLYYWGTLGLVLAMRRLEQSAGAVLVPTAERITNLQPVIPKAGAVRRRPS